MLGRGTRRTLLTIFLLILVLALYDARYGSKDQYVENFEDLTELEGLTPSNAPRYPPLIPKTLSPPSPKHRRTRNGLIETSMEGGHPIADLIDKAAATWKNRLARQSKTLSEAVNEYHRRYRRPPPKGFDDWWRFAKENNVILVDEFDQIDQNIKPFFALSAATFSERLDALETDFSFSFNIVIKNGTLALGGDRAQESGPRNMKALVEPLAQWLPDLRMFASDHDKGNMILGQDQYDAALELADEGSFLTESELGHYENLGRNNQPELKTACHSYSNAIVGAPEETDSNHTFLADPLASMNFCSNPSLLKYHGSWGFDHARQSKLVPIWVYSRWLQDQSFLLPALFGFENIIRDPNRITPWSQRQDSRLFWRGRSTGVDFRMALEWRDAHRTRMHFLGKNKNGKVELLQEHDPEEDSSGDLFLKSYPRQEVVEKYLDVGLVPPLIQCERPQDFCDDVTQEIGFLPEVSQSRGQDAKIQMDLDGNGWSQRFPRLMSTGSVVFKSTVYPDWNSNWLVPYYHYVPIKVDYTDLFDTMAFFVGWPDGTPGHDNLAEQISRNGLQFVKEHWRWEDAQAYMFRMLLEYARLNSPDRDAASYHG